MSNEIEKVTCPVCFGVEEDEPCDACHGRGYFLRAVDKPPVQFNDKQWQALPPPVRKIISDVEKKRHK